MAKGAGTKDKPWTLKTPPGTSEYQAWRDETLDLRSLVVQVGKTQVRYHLRCIEDLHAMLSKHGDWMPLGSADEGKDAADGTVCEPADGVPNGSNRIAWQVILMPWRTATCWVAS